MSIHIERDNLLKKYPVMPKSIDEALKFFPTQREYLVWMITINGHNIPDREERERKSENPKKTK